jgi:Methyltransferase FkbM domain
MTITGRNNSSNSGECSTSSSRTTGMRLLMPFVAVFLACNHLAPVKCPPSASADFDTSTGGRRTSSTVVIDGVLPSSLSLAATTTTSPQPQRQQRKIYIDLGVNCGNSYYLFKEGGVVGSRTTLNDSSDASWEAYLWEANPQMIDWYLNDLVASERALGRNVHLIPKAASTKDNTTISFYLTKGQELGTPRDRLPNAQCDPHSAYNPSGASSIYGNALRAGQEIKVEAIDFFAWFQRLDLQHGDIVHLKADIEGAELDIIERFLADDETHQICFWSQFWTEYHAAIFPVGSPEHVRHTQFETTFPLRFEEKCGRPLWPNGVLS